MSGFHDWPRTSTQRIPCSPVRRVQRGVTFLRSWQRCRRQQTKPGQGAAVLVQDELSPRAKVTRFFFFSFLSDAVDHFPVWSSVISWRPSVSIRLGYSSLFLLLFSHIKKNKIITKKNYQNFKRYSIFAFVFFIFTWRVRMTIKGLNKYLVCTLPRLPRVDAASGASARDKWTAPSCSSPEGARRGGLTTLTGGGSQLRFSFIAGISI